MLCFFPRLSSSSVLIFICCKITAGIKNLVYFYCALCEHWMWSGLKKASSKGTNKIRCQKQQHTITTVRVFFFLILWKCCGRNGSELPGSRMWNILNYTFFFHLFLLLKRKMCCTAFRWSLLFFLFRENAILVDVFDNFFSSFACQPIYLQKSLKKSQNT